MAIIQIAGYDLDEAGAVLNEEGINWEVVGGETLAEEMMIESFMENVSKMTPEKLDAFIKSLA